MYVHSKTVLTRIRIFRFQAIDKVARTARRTVDTHVKNALSKPRLATTIRRITAVFNFISEPRG